MKTLEKILTEQKKPSVTKKKSLDMLNKIIFLNFFQILLRLK